MGLACESDLKTICCSNYTVCVAIQSSEPVYSTVEPIIAYFKCVDEGAANFTF